MIKALLLAVIVPVALIHGYLYLQYGTGHPCSAAAKVLFDAGRFDLLAKMSTSPIDCYRIALFGVEGMRKAQSAGEREPSELSRGFIDAINRKRDP
jgi:hypothetical protein